MEKPFRQFTLSDCNFATDRGKNLVDLYKGVVEDENRAARRSDQKCRICFYRGGRMGGAATTRAYCGLCGEEMMFGSTATDVLCIDCAKAHRLCVECGADVELKDRRKL